VNEEAARARAGTAWHHVARRPARDIGGKEVDVHGIPENGRAFVYHLDGALPRNELQGEVIARLRRIRDARAKVVRERRFNVWYGTMTNVVGMELAAIVIPDRFAFSAWELLADLGDLPGEIEISTVAMRDLEGGPIARYDNGQIVVYLAPDASPDGADPDVEVRGAVVEAPRPLRVRAPMVAPTSSADRWHSMETWPANHVRILDFVHGLRAAGSYRRLRQVTTEHFGIRVLETLRPDSPLFGLLRIEWLRDEDGAGQVGVFLRSDLPADLKYVVLAHELSHYTLHFPMLHRGAVVEDIGRLIPEVRVAFRASVDEHLGANLLEEHADVLTSNFLLPPGYDLKRLVEVYMETGGRVSASELAWRQLQPLIPGAVNERFGWSNYNRMRELAKQDLLNVDDAPATIYARMLRAAVFYLDGDVAALSERVADGLSRVERDLDEVTGLVRKLGPEAARSALAQSPETLKSYGLPADLAASRYEFRPTRCPGDELPLTVHLVPAPGNARARDDRDWIDRHHPDGERATLEEWADLVPDDVALRVYRDEAWQASSNR